LRKASDYLEFDIHSLAAAIELYFINKGTEMGNAALDSLLLRTRSLSDLPRFRNEEAHGNRCPMMP